MTAKLLFLFEFAHASAASRIRAKGFSRNRAGLAMPSPPSAAKRIPQPRPRLECRWQSDPVTGALRAHWVCPAADSGAHVSAGDIVEDRRRLRPELAAAGSPGALRPAA